MNQNLTFSQAVDGYELTARARHLSDHTIADYKNTFKKFLSYYPGDPIITQVTDEMIESFLADQPVSNKTVLNYHVSLSALWSWATEKGFAHDNPLHHIKPPDAADPDIVPLTEHEVRSILAALTKSKTYKTHGTSASHALPDADRNRAIVLTLLDTGMRVTELCELTIRQVDIRGQNKTISIIDGKGKKDRHVPISATTAQAIWKYLATRPDARLSDPLFVTKFRKPINRHNLGDMLEAAAGRAGVAKANPHKWRHTFAINYLRNGGNVYTLQAILGHEDLDTCLIYLKLSQMDLDAGHRQASPVENWRL